MAPKTKKIDLCGWGRVPQIQTEAYRPERKREDAEILKAAASLVAYGNGRSYGDAALNSHAVILTKQLNRFLQFDRAKGVVQCEAGVTLEALMQVVIPEGWMVPVLPGTRHATLGGAVACNVHGKNAYRDGEFSDHVKSIHLRLPNGIVKQCGPQQEAALFHATVGGMGLTGIIETVTLKLKPIHSCSVSTRTRRCGNLGTLLQCFYDEEEHADYMVGWVDHTGQGEALGRGVFESATHATVDEGGTACSEYHTRHSRLVIPDRIPGFLLNKYTMALYNKKRFAGYSEAWKEEIQDFAGFFHPLDALANWNRLYGRRGFLQYQCLIPESPRQEENLAQLLLAIQERGLFSFLAVIKKHRNISTLRDSLTFTGNGFSLALDFPNSTAVHSMLETLDEMVAHMGGLVYLAKDARLSAGRFHEMYAEALPGWQQLVREVNPNAQIYSIMAARLNMLGEGDAVVEGEQAYHD